jgi:phosphoserine phosphatase
MNLVIQGPRLESQQAEEAARLAGTIRIEAISARAYRLRNAAPTDAVGPWCEKRHIDYAFIPEGRRFADLKLLAMDMDSTLITIECIDELGELAGKKAEVAAITAQAMRGEIAYPESLRQRVAAIAGLEEAALSRVYEERLCLTPGADRLLEACKAHSVKVLLVSGGFTFFTERLGKRLGIDYTISNTLEVRNGRLTGSLVGSIVDADAKAAKFREVAKELRARREETVAIGDGANDLKMMRAAGLSIAFRAKRVVQEQADCALNWSGLDAVLNIFE